MAPKKYKQKKKQAAQLRQQQSPKPEKRKPAKFNKNLLIGVVIIAVIVVAFAGLALSGQFGGNKTPTSIDPTKVLLQTTAGNITIDLRTDKPITSTNFINLVKSGKYDGTTFYRTVKDFMIQGGKINSTVPTINDEIGNNNRNSNYTIAMAKTSDANSATSEFFINTVDNGNKIVDQQGHKFDQIYTEFGTVIDGKDVVDAIANAPATENPNITGEISVPVNPVTIIHASIIT